MPQCHPKPKIKSEEKSVPPPVAHEPPPPPPNQPSNAMQGSHEPAKQAGMNLRSAYGMRHRYGIRGAAAAVMWVWRCALLCVVSRILAVRVSRCCCYWSCVGAGGGRFVRYKYAVARNTSKREGDGDALRTRTRAEKTRALKKKKTTNGNGELTETETK